MRNGRAGFSGYIGRDADVDTLYGAMWDVIAGRLACPAEISGGLLRALFRGVAPSEDPVGAALTTRERDIACYVGRGLSNKEIARELNLSVATVKHHVHNILGKLNVDRRTDVIRRHAAGSGTGARSERGKGV